jgi:hypothetical protein
MFLTESVAITPELSGPVYDPPKSPSSRTFAVVSRIVILPIAIKAQDANPTLATSVLK